MSDRIKITNEEILSSQRYLLKRVSFDYRQNDGSWDSQSREVYHRGDAAAVLLYNRKKQTVILARQFRLPTYLHGSPTGLTVEVCAGMLDDDSPEVAAIRETEEETGYRIKSVTKIGQAYASPAALTELLHLFIAEYDDGDKVNDGGGVDHEDIEVLEVPFALALSMLESGEITDTKTMLLLYYAQAKDLFA